MTIRTRLLTLLILPLLLFLFIGFYILHNLTASEHDNTLLILFIGGILAFALMILTVFLVADRLSKPLQQLNQAALEIAAGDYSPNIQVKGPKEIVELANTLDTMSECLVEHLNRLRESSVVRERMYGEYECALLLQSYMLEKPVQEFNHPAIRLRLVSPPLSPLQKGLFLKINKEEKDSIEFTLLEAKEQGFIGLFQLNQYAYLSEDHLKSQSYIKCKFLNHYHTLTYDAHYLFSPLIWSIKSKKFITEKKDTIDLQNHDMIFLFNSALIEHFKSEEAIVNWLSRVLRHFAEDGLETIHTMLMNELNFMKKKQFPGRNFQMLCMQVTLS